MNYTCAKCDPTEPHPDVDFCPKCDKQSARIRELEGALRDMLRHYDRTDGSAPVGSKARATRDHARRVLSEGSVKA